MSGRVPARVIAHHLQRVLALGPVTVRSRRRLARHPDPRARALATTVGRARPAAFAHRRTAIERVRGELASEETAARHRMDVERLEALAHRASTSARWGGVLRDIVVALRPARVLEMGTAVGISAAYLAAGLDEVGGGEIVSVDRDGRALGLAAENLDRLGLAPRARLLEGAFDDVLGSVVDGDGAPFDMVFKDGDHTAGATLAWVRTLERHLAPGAVVVLDDIRRSAEMTGAWRALQSASSVAFSLDFLGMGLLALGRPTGAGPDRFVIAVR